MAGKARVRTCPKCGSPRLAVDGSKPKGRDSLLFRFRCTVCQHKWWEK